MDRVVEDFMDVGTPLKQFTEAVVRPCEDEQRRDTVFEEKAKDLTLFGEKAVRTAKMVAVGTNSGNKKTAEAIFAFAGQVRHSLFFTELFPC